jgi:hypothetical protein
MRALALLFLLSGCGVPHVGTPTCKSACGLRLFDSEDCDGLAIAEYRSIEALTRNVVQWSRELICNRLSDTEVYVKEPGSDGETTFRWNGHDVYGQYECGWKITLASDAWSAGALTHEIAHVVEKCADETHATWEFRGIYRAINEARTYDLNGAP